MKRIAIIGHTRTMSYVTASIRQAFKEIETVEIEFIDAEMTMSAVEYLKAQLPSLDGLVFTGRKPYEIINHAMGISIPQTYIPHDRSIFLQTLLEATTIEGYDIKSFSCDSYSYEALLEGFKGFGVGEESLNLYTMINKVQDDLLVQATYEFHKKTFEAGLVSFCMTGISMVYEKLQSIQLPCLLMHPTTEAVNNGVRQVLMQINAIESTESQIVVISMEIDLPNEYNLIHDNDYQLMLEKSRVSEQVYKFAESIQAAVIEIGSHNYMLFSTKQILESATEELQSIAILKDVARNSAHTLSVGIGYGKTAREAKYSASLGLNSALKKGGNQACSVKEGKLSAPILPNPLEEIGQITIADPLFKVISAATGISINTIYRLQCIKERTKKDCFTSGELAKAFGNTRRSMNRIIGKLEAGGYVVVEGTRMMSETGRPTRVIRLRW